ncbi:hypothetical protein BJ980_001665 [Nocardioides daedukensis]|uniref:Uncharacterized protein n=1 Tax=Nocardioides daedukensis TaxID=634462 RepID=A0A7Y9S1G3_9ACTN|nr:hypothetical protein [Nocardioides daedukensis]NYG58742.1 hypothetical protein [Nocardioides daedukensis]
MSLPTPEDPGRTPVWENYVVAQVAQASLGQIPEHALAVGVEVEGPRLRLRFQLSEATEGDRADMDDIVSELESLVGKDVEVASFHEVLDQRAISPTDGVRRIFLARVAA